MARRIIITGPSTVGDERYEPVPDDEAGRWQQLGAHRANPMGEPITAEELLERVKAVIFLDEG